MQNHTSFDLNFAIRQWRQNLAEAPAFQQTDLDELESHLRDSTADLQTAGLSAEEAFVIASRRIGPAGSLATEFRKIRPVGAVWECVLWGCVGLQIWFLLSKPLSFVPGIPLLIAGAVALMISKTFRRHADQALAWCVARPVLVSATLLLLGLCKKTLLTTSLWVYAGDTGMDIPLMCLGTPADFRFLCTAYVRGHLNILPELAVCTVLIATLVLSRKTGQTEARIAG
jgi:hypothetical protein